MVVNSAAKRARMEKDWEGLNWMGITYQKYPELGYIFKDEQIVPWLL